MCDPRVSSDLSWDKGHGICQAKLANNSCCRGKEEIKKRMSKKTFLLLQPANLTVVCRRRIPTGEDGYINNTFLISIWIWFSCALTGQSFQKHHTISHGDGQHRNVCTCIQLVKSSCPGGSALLQSKCRSVLWDGTWPHVRVPAGRWWSPSFKAILLFFQGKPCRLNIILKTLPLIGFVISFSLKEMVWPSWINAFSRICLLKLSL